MTQLSPRASHRNGAQDTVLVGVEHVTEVIAARAQRTMILDDIRFSVPRGSLFAINGPSGSGKSAMLNMLTGLDLPTGGRMIFEGRELRAKSENARGRWRGRHVYQVVKGQRFTGDQPNALVLSEPAAATTDLTVGSAVASSTATNT